MRVAEQNTFLDLAVKIRRLCLRVTPRRADPVIQIVDRKEKNVGVRTGTGQEVR